MLKIHSFLQRVKRPLEKSIPNGKNRTVLAMVIYVMVAVVLLLSPDYMNGKGVEDTTSHAEAQPIQAANNITGETASETVVRNDKSYGSGQILQNELNTYSTPVVNLMSQQLNSLTTLEVNGLSTNLLNLVTSDICNINQVISANNDSSDEVISDVGNSQNKEMLNSSIASEVANTNQALVGAKQVDSGSTKEEVKESTLSVSSTDEKTQDTKETQSNSLPDGAKTGSSKESAKDSEKVASKETSSNETQVAKKESNVVNLKDKDVEILQRIVEAEASGETIKGKMLVANVILNRVKDSYFPDTVEGVVFQSDGGTYQFSPIKDGRYYSVKVSSDTKKAVSRVLKGEDESKGALYFSARSRADRNSMKWFDNNLTFLFEYGGHEFFR